MPERLHPISSPLLPHGPKRDDKKVGTFDEVPTLLCYKHRPPSEEAGVCGSFINFGIAFAKSQSDLQQGVNQLQGSQNDVVDILNVIKVEQFFLIHYSN